MSATTNPELLIMPLARDGEKNTLPETTGATTGEFSQQYGFQQINSTPLTAGGKAPDRKDINGAFNLLSGISFFAQKGWTFHYDSTQDYYLGCVVIDPADGNRYECIADMAAGTVAPHADEDNTYWRRFTLADGMPIGAIIQYSANGELPSGYLLCDGAAYSRTMFPDLFSVIGTTYGAGDGSTTFNVPDYNVAQRFAQGGTVAGVEKEAGLPNITGTLNTWADTPAPEGAFSLTTESDLKVEYGTFYQGKRKYLRFNASNSSAIYGNSDTVQPNALTTRYIIKAFDGQTADSALIDITQYAQELAGKANITGSNMVYHRDVITTSGTYTAPVTGLYKITVKGGGGGGQGGGHNTSYNYGGYGGGEGGTTIAFEKMTAGQTATVVIGAGGTGGAGATNSSPGNGGLGGSSIVTVNNNAYTGNGGMGGHSGTSGGSGTINGAPGASGMQTQSQYAYIAGGAGGGNGGGVGQLSDSGGNGEYGAGGAGGGAGNTTSYNGGTGGDGYVWFEYYTPGA